MLLQEFFDAMSQPASLVAYPNGELLATIHLPLKKQGLDMKMYEFSDLPTKTSKGWYGFESSKKYLAVSQKPATQFFALTEMEFQRCTESRGVYSCKQRTPIYTQGVRPEGVEDTRCLHALWLRAHGNTRSDEYKTFCRLSKKKVFDSVSQLSSNKFAFFTNNKDQGRLRIRCTSNFDETYAPSHVYLVDLPAGCEASTRGLTVYSTEEMSTHAEEFSYNAPSIGSLFNLAQMSEDRLEKIASQNITNLQELDNIDERFKVSAARAKLHEVGLVTHAGGVGWTVGASIILVLVAICAFIIYTKCYKERKERLKVAYHNQKEII